MLDTEIEHLPVGHPDDEDVVERVHAVDLGQQLVHHGVGHARAVGDGAPLLADGVDLVEDHDVKHAALALLRLGTKYGAYRKSKQANKQTSKKRRKTK